MRRSSRSSAGGRALVRVVTSTAGFMSTAFLAFVAFGGLLAAVGARAEVATIDVLLDLDRNPATGCAVTTIDGAAEGVDLRVRTLFDVGTETVTSASTATCADPMLDVFGGESAIASVPLPTWTGALGNGVKGSMLIESHVPLSLTGVAPRARAFVVLSSLVGEDALLVSESGASLLVALRAPPVPSAGAFALAGLLLGAFAVGRRELRSRAVVVGLAGSIVVASLLAPARGWALLGEGGSSGSGISRNDWVRIRKPMRRPESICWISTRSSTQQRVSSGCGRTFSSARRSATAGEESTRAWVSCVRCSRRSIMVPLAAPWRSPSMMVRT